MENDFQIENGILKCYTGRQEFIAVPECVHTIGEDAFKGGVSLQKVVLPSGIRSIMPRAFKGCRRLREIEIPAGVSYIGDYAFHRCHSLVSISLPDSVKELGDCVFLYCDSLNSVRIPGVRHLGKQVFVNDVLLEKLEISPELQEECICDVFTGCCRISEISFSDGRSFSFPNAVEVVAGEMDVPPLVRTIAVDILRMMALEGRCVTEFLINLKHMEIPEGIEKIGKSAFFDKRGIISVIFPSTLKEIESRAFRNCISLETVIFRQDQVVVHEDAFQNCSSLKEVRTSDGASYSLEGIGGISGEDVPALVRSVRKQVLGNFRLSGSILLKYLGNESRVVVPEGVVRIAEEAFAGKETVEKVILPDTVEEIGAGAFRDCLLLQTVNFPQDLRHIGAGAFENCVKLLRALLPDHLEKVEDQVFKRCVRLKELTFGKGVRSIGEQAFYGCFSLREVCFLDSLVSVGSMAFYRCQGLKEVHLLPGVEYVGNLAFAQSGIKRAGMEGSGKKYGTGIFSQCLSLHTVVLEKGVRHIPDKLAYGCTALERVILPDMLESVGRNVWEHTPFLRNWLGKRSEGCLEGLEGDWKESREGDWTESQEENRKGDWIENREGDWAKSQEGNQKGAWKESQEENRGGDQKESQEGNRGEDWTESQEEIGQRVRKGDWIESQKENQEKDWKENQEGDWKEDWERNRKESWGEIFWDGRNLKGDVILPKETRIVAGGAFYGNCAITSICFPDHVTWIGGAALKGCTELCHVTWPRAVTTVEEEVFSGCEKLESIVPGAEDGGKQEGLPESCFDQDASWKVVKDRAFYNCSKLSHILWRDIQRVGKEAFCGCVSLEIGKVDSLKYVGENAFEGVRAVVESPELGTGNGAVESSELGNGKDAMELSLVSGGNDAWESSVLGDGDGVMKSSGLCIVGSILISGKYCHGEICVPEGITAIAPYAFSGNRRITGVILPETIRYIGEGAFWGCSGLVEIRFPAASCSIGARAFEKCTGIRTICLHADSAGTAAFAYCLSLEKAELNGLSILGSRLFEGCENLKECVCEQASVVEDHCFCGCKNLRGFDFQLVREIGSYAFQDCDMLREIAFGGHTLVRPHGFEDCGRLERIVLTESRNDLKRIALTENRDDLKCSAYTESRDDLEWSAYTESRGNSEWNASTGSQGYLKLCEYAFSGCTALRQVVWQERLYELHTYREILSEKLPEAVRLVFHSAFSCFEIDKEEMLCGYRGLGRIVKIPEGIRRIEGEVFQDRLMLEQVSIPETVEYIGPRAFHKTAWMERQREISPMVVANHMLLDGSCCTGEVVVPEDIRIICGWAFAGGMGIEKIRFLSDRVKVEDFAFRNCIFLRELVLADGFTVVFDGISDRKKELPVLAEQAVRERLNCFKTDEKDVLVECTGNISRLLAADGITAIGDNVFQEGNLLTEVILPRTVVSIGRNSFAGCKWLRRVSGAQCVKSIGSRAFSGCGSLEEIELSEKLTEIGVRAFENCTSLREILLPEGMEEIPDRAFFRCHSLQKVLLPSTLKRIGKEAFAFCENLEMPVVPDSVLVEERAFAGTGLLKA